MRVRGERDLLGRKFGAAEAKVRNLGDVVLGEPDFVAIVDGQVGAIRRGELDQDVLVVEIIMHELALLLGHKEAIEDLGSMKERGKRKRSQRRRGKENLQNDSLVLGDGEILQLLKRGISVFKLVEHVLGVGVGCGLAKPATNVLEEEGRGGLDPLSEADEVHTLLLLLKKS